MAGNIISLVWERFYAAAALCIMKVQKCKGRVKTSLVEFIGFG